MNARTPPARRRLRFERLESRALLSITISSNEVWDGVSNPHAADGVILNNGVYWIPTGITIGPGVTVRLDSTTPLPTDEPSNSITWVFAPGGGGLTFANASSTIDVHPGVRARSSVAVFTLNMNDNDIAGLAPGAGRIINGPFVTGGGNTGDTMSVAINSQADVTLGAIDIGVNDATTGAITINATGVVDVGRLSNADVNAGGNPTKPINVVGGAIALGNIDTRSNRPGASVGDINLRALAQPADDPAAYILNSASVNLITLRGTVTTNASPTNQTGGNLTLAAAKVVLAPSFSTNVSEQADLFVTVGAVQSGFSEQSLFVNSSTATPDKLNFVIFHDGSLPDLMGDANLDGVVDAADYTVWRDTLGSQSSLSADFNRSGTVDASDYAIWRAQYGKRYVAPPQPNSVTLYGATPNDGSFDGAAIQAAVNTFGSVYFPAGEYRINSPIVVPAGRTLYGPDSGPPAIIYLPNDYAATANDYAKNAAILIGGDNVTIRNLAIDKNFVDGSYGIGIYAEGRSNIAISRVDIRKFSARYGIFITYSNDIDISNVYVHDFLMDEGGVAADMVDSSPAGIRIHGSTNAAIRDSRIHNIEVGPNGRASTSELRPEYGPQGYQADGITITASSHVVVERNNVWNSGELVDNNTSDHVTIRDNLLQMAYLFVVKNIGAQDSVISGNYLADGPIGVWVGNRLQLNGGGIDEEATRNLIESNDIVNMGSRGIWNIAASSRLGLTRSGVYLDNNASGNTVANNRIYNYYGYISTYVRQGSGSNTFSNNSNITSEFGPSGVGNVEIIGSWSAGLNHAKELIALNRALIFYTFATSDDADVSASAVTYGGRSLSKASERLIADGSTRVYIAAWFLKQDAINTASGGNFNVTWNFTLDSVGYSSVFLANVHQSSPLRSEDTGGPQDGQHLRTSPRITQSGDLVLLGATAAHSGEFTPGNGFSEGIELAIADADATTGFKRATGQDEFADVAHTDLLTGVISMIVLTGDNYLSQSAIAPSALLLPTDSKSINVATAIFADYPVERRSAWLPLPNNARAYAITASAERNAVQQELLMIESAHDRAKSTSQQDVDAAFENYSDATNPSPSCDLCIGTKVDNSPTYTVSAPNSP